VVTHPAHDIPEEPSVLSQNASVNQVGTVVNDEIEQLRNSLRTFRLSNDGLSMFLERTQNEVEISNARVTQLEHRDIQLIIEYEQEVNLRLLAEGRSVDMNSRHLVSEFDLRQKIQLQAESISVKDTLIQALTNEKLQLQQIIDEQQLSLNAKDEEYARLNITNVELKKKVQPDKNSH
jgi:hypothetical protein